MIAAHITKNFYDRGGLIYTVTYFFMNNAIVPAILNFLDVERIWRFI